jgi:TMEM175 potassium channel family protein
VANGDPYARTVAFSDGVFAIAITLLVLGIDVPDVPESQLADSLSELGPSVLSYFIGFAVIGAFWVGHHRFFAELARFDLRIVGLNLFYLSLIGVMPFTTNLLGDYGDEPIAVAIYAANVAATSLVDTGMSAVAVREGLWVASAGGRRAVLASLLTPAVFCASIPIAYLDADAAMWSWLSLAVIPWLARRHRGLERARPSS